MPKVLLVANTDWYLYNFRLSLAKDLRQSGYEVVLVSPSGPYYPRLQAEGFRWLEWNAGRQSVAPWSEIQAIVRLAQIYRREQPQVVHHFTVKPVLYGSLVARWTGVKAIVNSVTGLGYVFLSPSLKAGLIRQAVKSLYRLALASPNSGAIFENDTDRQYFLTQRLIPAERTWLIYGVGVDPEHFTPVSEPPGPPLILLPARMLWDKGVGVLVDAARSLKQKADVRIVLVGEPDPGNPASIHRERLERWQEEGVVEWWGWQENMREIYHQAHIVTLPSFREGVPTALLEAAACGRPLVATDVAGCRDVVVDGCNGFLVPARDPQALGDALYKLVVDAQLRQRMGAAGRELVLERYTHATVNAATQSVYQALLNKGK